MQLRVVHDVLADPLLALAVQVDDGGLTEELAAGLELEAFELVPSISRGGPDGVVEGHSRENATATSAASRALATTSARLTSRVRPPLRSCRREHERRDCLPGDALRGRSGHGLLDQASASRLSGGGFPRRRPAPPSSQCAAATAAASCILDALRDRRAALGRVEERQRASPEAEHRDASVSSSSLVAGTSSSDLTPEEATSAGVLASVGTSAETSGEDAEAAVDAADATRAQEADPDEARDRQHAADRRRADGTLDGARGEIAWAGLAGVGGEAGELALREPDLDAAVEHADRRGKGARPAHGGVALEPDREPVGAGNPCATRVVSSATTG